MAIFEKSVSVSKRAGYARKIGQVKKTKHQQQKTMFESGTAVASDCTQEACKCGPA